MHTLYGKFLLFFLPLTTLTFIFFSIISTNQMYSEGLDKLQIKMERMLQSQSMIMAEKVWLNDLEKLHLNAASIIADPDVIGIKIIGADDNILGTYAWDDVIDEHLVLAGNINYVVDYKVEKVGDLKIAYTNENVLQDIQEITFDRIQLFAGFLIFTLLASFLAYQLTVHKVLARLSKAFESSGAGNSDEIDWVSSDDDIGSMVNSFNCMQQRTQQYENQIINYQGQLESLVDKRTIDLQSEIKLHKKTQDDLFSEKERIRTTLESIEDAVINITPEGHIAYYNDSAKQVLGFELLEQSLHYTDTLIIKYEDGSLIKIDPIENCIKNNIDVNGKNYALLVTSNKKQLTIQFSIRAIFNARSELTGAVFSFRDVTSSREIEKEMEYNASHDNLTGLINRRQFEVEVQNVIDSFKPGDIGHWICYIDLDRFKIVNDTCGHAAGDDLLKQISELVRSKLRREDSVSRLGGDEFGVLMINCPLEAATRIMEDIRTGIDEFQLVWDEQVMKVGCSIGVAHIWKSQLLLNDLLRNADTACYIAKRKGGSRVHIHHDGDEEIAAEQDQMSWVAHISRALEEDRFVLFAQQILALDKNDKYPRYEVLLRMIDKNEQLIAPGLFLPAAERFKLSRKIDVWVFEKVITILKEYESIDFQLSVNVTADLFSDVNLTNGIVEKVRKYPHIADRLCVEITESTAISHMSNAKKVIQQLRSVGVKVALDDFGAGVSSFGYLQQLPIDFIKIDGQFVRNCSNSGVDQAIIKCIYEVANSMGKLTVAEYVESDEIKSFLQQVGINYAQGFGIKKPEPLADVLHQLCNESNKVIELFGNID